jgi:hypothetical protein
MSRARVRPRTALRVALLAVSAPVATPGLAATTLGCVFVTECVDAACAETSYAFDVEMSEMEATIATPAETLGGRVGLTGDGAPFVVAITDGAVHLLTVMDAAGSARYTVHLAGAGMAITYLGRCQDESRNEGRSEGLGE